MRAVTLLYHDVVDDADSSGFPGGGPARYKLPVAEFERHLEALAEARPEGPSTAEELREESENPMPFLITFDDGGSSALAAADMLDGLRWRGHFLITVQPIGTRGFLSASGIRDLRRRGHAVGSHSFSHPDPMSACAPEVLRGEWARSVRALEDILGEPVRIASVPGGSYSRKVARAAASAGVRILFTSEPVTRAHEVDGCRVFGRYTLWRGVPASTAAALARCEPGPRLRQFAGWNARKAAKAVGGRHYLRLRRVLLARRHGPAS